MYWGPNARKYEYEYGFASRLGQVVGRKMIRDDTRIVKVFVRDDNEISNWLVRRGGYGGWSQSSPQKCFDRELFWGWLGTQEHRPELLYTQAMGRLKVIRSENEIWFIDLFGLPFGSLECVSSITRALRNIELMRIETCPYAPTKTHHGE